MKIGGFQKLSLIDYPGKLACTVFLVGCNFRCPWCHNSSLVLSEKIKKQPLIPKKDFLDFLKKRKSYLEGVVLSGGEPTIHPELIDFCKKIKNMGYAIKLDTNGLNLKAMKELINKRLIDYVAMDIKAPKQKYIELIGVKDKINFGPSRSRFWKQNIIEGIEESVDFLKQGVIDYEFRTTMVPELIKKEDILKIAKWISPAPKYFLQEFMYEETINSKFKRKKQYENEYLIEVLKAIEPFFETCELRLAN